MLKTKVERYGKVATTRKNTTWKSGWRNIGGQKIYARSAWEANFARYLEFLKQHGEIAKWEHEPETFWFEKIKRGSCSYLPDFKVTRLDGSVYYVEVKGWMDTRSKTKLRRMKKYHPDVTLDLVDKKRYLRLARTCAGLIKGWE